jgi:hypothetical protein
MPRATAVWLVDNTSLTFEQIAEFCGVHVLEIQSIADGDLDFKMVGFDPVSAAQLTFEEIRRCEGDPSARLQIKKLDVDLNIKVPRKRSSSAKSVENPNKNEAIAWMLKYYPTMSEGDLRALLGTTTRTLRAIKNKTHKCSAGLEPMHPVDAHMCSQEDFDFYVAKLSRK